MTRKAVTPTTTPRQKPLLAHKPLQTTNGSIVLGQLLLANVRMHLAVIF